VTKIARSVLRDEPDGLFGSSLRRAASAPEIDCVNARPNCWFVLGLVAAALCFAGADDEAAVKNELARHQGTWIATSSTFDGQTAPGDIVRSIQRIVTNDQVVWERNGKRFAGTKVVLDETTVPPSIDVIPDGGRNRGEHILSIYKLEKGKLTICMAAAGKPRPKEFMAEKASGCTLQTFERTGADRTPPR